MATSRSAWKRAEQSAAAIFGAMRRPLSGSSNRADIDGDDATHPRLWIESKLRASWSVFGLWRTVKAATSRRPRAYQGGGKTPVLVLREKRKLGCLIVCHADDFGEVAVEWLAARDDRTLLEIEAAVRARRGDIDGTGIDEARGADGGNLLPGRLDPGRDPGPDRGH